MSPPSSTPNMSVPKNTSNNHAHTSIWSTIHANIKHSGPLFMHQPFLLPFHFLAQVSTRPYATLHSMLLFIVCQHSQWMHFQSGRPNCMIVFVVNVAFSSQINKYWTKLWNACRATFALQCLRCWQSFETFGVLALKRLRCWHWNIWGVDKALKCFLC